MHARRDLTVAAWCGWGGCRTPATGEMLDPADRSGETWLPVCTEHGGRETPRLVCAGRNVDHQALTSVGEPCGRTFKGAGRWGPTVEQQLEQARAAGWSVAGPLPMCPRCRRPDPTITRGLVVQGVLSTTP